MEVVLVKENVTVVLQQGNYVAEVDHEAKKIIIENQNRNAVLTYNNEDRFKTEGEKFIEAYNINAPTYTFNETEGEGLTIEITKN